MLAVEKEIHKYEQEFKQNMSYISSQLATATPSSMVMTPVNKGRSLVESARNGEIPADDDGQKEYQDIVL